MALTSEQVKELKAQLVSQVEGLPESQKKQALAQIESLSPEALESMLSEQRSKKSSAKESDKPVLRKIVDGEIESFKIAENKQAIAVLDIYPISKGHTIIIPRIPVTKISNMPSQALNLAKKIAKKAATKLKAKTAEIQTENKFGEEIVNIIPIYGEPLTLSSPRTQAKKEDLESMSKLLKIVKRTKKVKVKKEDKPVAQSVVIKRSMRIP